MNLLHRPAAWPLVVILAAVLPGCGEDPRAILDAMARAYRDADAYADEARVVVRETRGDTSTEATHPFRVAFSRPDRIRIEAYDARIVTDGTSLFAAVGGVPGQVLVEPVKSPLAMDQIFADDHVRATLAEGEAGCPTQLPLLLADDTIDLVLADATAPARIAGTETVDGRKCIRVTVAKPDGVLELWIDEASRLLRRMKVPTDAYAAELSRQAGAPVGISVVVDFVGASFDAAPPVDAFAFEVPASAARVTRLEPLSPPEPVHDLVGRKAELPPLTGLDREALAGKPVVLEFFFAGCGPSAHTMPQVATGIAEFVATHARAHAGARPDVRHLAISIDADDVTPADLRKKLAEFGGVGMLVRDPEAVVARSLGLESFPATVVIAADGTVADVIVGRHGRIAADVNEVLTASAAGRSTTDLVKRRHESRVREYRRELDRAAGKGRVERLPEQVIAPRRQPDRFKLERAWRAPGVSLPGNVVCLDAATGAAEPRIVALDGWRTVVELDASGREVGRRELPLPPDAGVGFLRTATDSSGRRWWLGGRRGGQQVFILSGDFSLRAAYPEAGGAVHEGITDADLADVDGDGEPEVIVGYLGSVGVQVATLDGKRVWRDRSLGSVLDVAVGSPAETGEDREVLCVTGDGRLERAARDREGSEAPGDEGGLRLHALAAGPVAADAAYAILGITGDSVGRQRAVGIDPRSLRVEWEVPLADGVHRDGPIDPVAWVDLLGTTRRQWLIAAPDGSVTVAWADGRVVDRYCHGRPLVGIGGYRDRGTGHVVLATREGLEAYAIVDVALD
jgi:outer membrane lipoprotein-sorting protein